MNNFARVREAFSGNALQSLKRLGVAVKSETLKDWIQVCCPSCNEKSGSASVSAASGFLRCHQCSVKLDLFSWFAKQINTDNVWLACQKLAEALGVDVQSVKRQRITTRGVPAMDPELLADFRQRLFDDPDCELARDFLKGRNFWHPEALERLPIGAYGSLILFFQYDPHGKLQQRCKVYNPCALAGTPKWSYSSHKGNSIRSVGFWPPVPDSEGEEPRPLLLTEGEWDAMAAIIRLELPSKGWDVVCWTGGGGAPIPKECIPKHFRDREVHIVYDNDVFQGLEEEPRAPDDKKLAELTKRRMNLIENVAASFHANRCNVQLRSIPIDPLEKWGADLRDMVDGGLRSIDDLPIWPLTEARKEQKKPKRIEFSEVHKHLNEYIEFRCQVAGVNEDVVVIPSRHSIDCAAGSKKFCDYCKVPGEAPNGVFDWAGQQHKLAAAMTSSNMIQHVMERVLEKPSSCKGYALTPVESSPGARWVAMACEGDDIEGARLVEVISGSAPPMSGELLVRGYLWIGGNGVTPVLFADRLEAQDRVQLPIAPHQGSLLIKCPHRTETVADIDAFLEDWHKDVSNHTTHVYGRRDIHYALGLAMHSVLWFDAFGARRRGWIDACIIGNTRSGKSAAARAYLKALQLGQHFTPMGNFSRPGLTIGTMQINGQSKTRPGVFPRNHGKLLAMDESHLMVQDHNGGEGLFPMLQGARDMGRVEVAKIAGSQGLPAAVRLIAIANWLHGGRTSFQTPAHHLLGLYGTPESLARLDFGIPVDGDPEYGPEKCEHFWTTEVQRVVAIRAWNMQPEDVVIEPEALELAQSLCSVTWKGRYSEEVPLYTEREKVYSVLRVAIAVANMTLSHPEEQIHRCLVREVHVQWAKAWFEHTWALLEYDLVSRRSMAKMQVGHVWTVEACLSVSINLKDPASVRFVLGRLFGTLTKEEMRSVLGLSFIDFERWSMDMVRAGALEVVRPVGPFGGGVNYRMTKPAMDIVQTMIAIADNEPEAWKSRFEAISSFWSSRGMSGKKAPDLIPIDAPLETHIHDFRSRSFPDYDAG